MTFRFLLILTLYIIAEACNSAPVPIQNRPLAKFEPPFGSCILFVGQDMESIGGLYNYKDGYYDYFENPGGFSINTAIRPGDESYGFVFDGLPGLSTTDDWGNGPSNMNALVAGSKLKNSVVAVGLDMANHEKEIADGNHDDLIKELASWVARLGRRPVFLCIRQESDIKGNNADKEAYIQAFRRIRNIIESVEIDNIAFVWQSQGQDQDQEDLEGWYPGDPYVDWCGFSLFSVDKEVQMIDFARRHNKPVFIAQASPVLSAPTTKIDGKPKLIDLSDPIQANEAWQKWFEPFFKLIDENQDVIKAINYINAGWKYKPMWEENPMFQAGDSRLQLSREISTRWKEETAKQKYLKASPELFDILWKVQM